MGGFLYTMITPGGGSFAPFKSCPEGLSWGGWFWMKLIPALDFSEPFDKFSLQKTQKQKVDSLSLLDSTARLISALEFCIRIGEDRHKK